jgi:hypothetical protein
MRLLATGLASLALAALADSAAPLPPLPAAVPVYEEPLHRPVFQNRLVRLLDVNIPAGATTGYHTHTARIAGAVIQDAKNWSQVAGADPEAVGAVREAGTVMENWAAELPYTHRVSNVDVVPIHYVIGECLASPGIESAPLPETASRHLVREGKVARFYRIELAPGESTGPHTHTAPGLTIQATAGSIDDSGTPPEARGGAGAGAWRWRGAETSHVLRNEGPRRAVVVEIDWR